ncbi:DUF294 nucleotidyltransferase-like domain-containing protein [Suttonella sp. R2A3]|uniref:DUF294 nucleotidyltransferase-like domain-containing protein n=1 Tax=Suttonella sp. R2A3 TaxID=2908648 RepID=UPI001F42EF31|nr:DUF294 nucleotidyltransferase-like domain-containing protein [Suttonella sp. R2A3]UJF25386.1 DUF294 nucleotidyltransferase-like domain-containing protein [Suttonella sp. R2A3]
MHALSLTQPPFDLLSASQRERLQRSAEVVYLTKDETLDESLRGDVFVVIKGSIEQRRGDDFHAQAYPDDWFTTSNADLRILASENSLLYRLAQTAILDVCAENDGFAALFSDRLQERRLASQKSRQETQTLMFKKVRDCYLREPQFIHASASILEATRALRANSSGHILVHQHKRVGMFSSTNLCDAVIAGVDVRQTEVEQFTHFKLVTIHQDKELSEALQMMVSNRIRRLPVLDDEGKIIGVLGQIDLLSFFTNHSHLIALDIEQAKDLDALDKAADKIGEYIRSQYENGVKTSVISSMVQTLNLQVFTRLWHLLAPKEIIENTCLFVMGSEGRGEQILRTDQDNGLILADGFSDPRLDEVAEQFNAALAKMGYPLCDGHIMLNNPL